MSRMMTVMRREYLERVRSRAFLVSTFLGPVLVVAVMIGPTLLMARQRGKPLQVSIVDATGTLSAPVERALAGKRVADAARFTVVPLRAADPEEGKRAARAGVVEGRLDGFLYLGADALSTSQAEYYAKNVSNVMDIQMLEKAVDHALLERRLSQEGLEGSRAQLLMRKLDLRPIRLSATGDREDRGASFILALMLFTLLYSTVLMWGAAIMNGVIEEKTNRVVEVIVSSLPTSSLFAGKLLGVGAAGLTQFLVWSLTMAAFGVYGVPLPELSPLLLASFVVYFLLGYFLYGALYAAVGSAVNTQQEAQSLAFPVMMPLVVGFVFFPAVLSSPDSPLAVVLSLIPLFTPMLMFLRITALTPPAWQIALSLVLTLAAVVLVTWAASRVYRVGILMYGKRPTFPEIVRWARRS
jgi:ABC-2 type transport system permease protein